MPSIPTKIKLFFCRITRPFDLDTFENLHLNLTHISNKFYSHPIDVLAYCHEVGLKTEKPHYHLLIICKTTKPEVTKLIKNFFKVTGNEDFSVVDKYLPETVNISLSYMFKGGSNGEKFRMFFKTADGSMPSEETLIEIYNNNNQFMKLSDAQKKFKFYLDLVKKELPNWVTMDNFQIGSLCMPSKENLFKWVYRILLKETLSHNVFFRFSTIQEHTRVICLHLKPYLTNYYIDSAVEKEFKVI